MTMPTPQLKAISWYCTKYNLTPQLSVPPTFYFTNKITKEKVTKDITGIVLEYKAHVKEEAAEAARLKKQKPAKKTGWFSS